MIRTNFLILILITMFLSSCAMFWWDKRERTIGYVLESKFSFATGDPTYISYKYEVDNVEYKGRTSISGWINFPKDHKFKVYYNSNNPKRSSLNLREPIYEEKNMKSVNGKIINTSKIRKTNLYGKDIYFDFSYRVGFHEYEMRNFFSLTYLDSTLTDEDMERFLNRQVQIEYDITNPQISRITLESLKSRM